jgi:hypothetical protein
MMLEEGCVGAGRTLGLALARPPQTARIVEPVGEARGGDVEQAVAAAAAAASATPAAIFMVPFFSAMAMARSKAALKLSLPSDFSIRCRRSPC